MKELLAANKQILVRETTNIKEGIKLLDSSPLKILLVTNSQDQFVGTVVDGDVRRGILRGVELQASLAQIMNKDPVICFENEDKNKYKKVMKKKMIRHLPVLDANRRVVGIESIDDLVEEAQRNNPVVIMAGGLGSRLGELTQQMPKSLLPIGDKSLIEISLNNLMGYGFKKFILSVNYKADMIKEAVGDGSRWGVEVEYLEETTRLGTAGPLSLLQNKVQEPFLVMNGDILTRVDFNSLMDFHQSQGAKATMCVKEYDFQVPYGVVQIDGSKIKRIDEKPVQKFFVNAGIYVLNPEVLSLVPQNTYFDMPSLFDKVLSQGAPARAFPIMEYWLDIGRHADFARAQFEYINYLNNNEDKR